MSLSVGRCLQEELDRGDDSTLSALGGKREPNAEDTAGLRQLWEKRVRMSRPGRHERDPKKCWTCKLLGWEE